MIACGRRRQPDTGKATAGTAFCGSDKAGGGDFTPEEADRLRELAAYAGAALDAFRAARSASGSG